jgi:RNA polymerase sigma factor (sigma-70 family)
VALPLVPFCAAGLCRRGYLPATDVQDDDMLQEGRAAIGEALKRWDPVLGRMSSYLVPRIRGAMLDWTAEAYKGGIASKHTACTLLDMEETVVDGEFEPQDQPGLHAQAAGFSRLDMLTYEGIYGSAGLEESSAHPNAQAVELAAKVEDLMRLLDSLPEDLADTIRLAYGIGCAQLSADEIADLTGLSRRTVYRRIEDGVAQLQEKVRHCK